MNQIQDRRRRLGLMLPAIALATTTLSLAVGTDVASAGYTPNNCGSQRVRTFRPGATIVDQIAAPANCGMKATVSGCHDDNRIFTDTVLQKGSLARNGGTSSVDCGSSSWAGPNADHWGHQEGINWS